MKKKILMVTGLLLCLAVGPLGTLTYFTAEEKAHNVITTGNIDIELNEWSLDEEENRVPFEDVDGIVPGAVVDKIVEVENTGSNSAWVRVELKKEIALADGKTVPVDLSLIELDLDTENWIEKDGYYYYNVILNPGETTTPLFNTVTFRETMGNDYQSSTITIDVIAQATQSDNNGTTVLDALGWPAE